MTWPSVPRTVTTTFIVATVLWKTKVAGGFILVIRLTWMAFITQDGIHRYRQQTTLGLKCGSFFIIILLMWTRFKFPWLNSAKGPGSPTNLPTQCTINVVAEWIAKQYQTFQSDIYFIFFFSDHKHMLMVLSGLH